MSDFVLFKGRNQAGQFQRDYSTEITRIDYAPGMVTRAHLTDGRTGVGACLGCADAPCIAKDVDELAMPAALDSFPGDPSLSVCPTKAIDWDKATGFASIDSERCIGCGLCVKRCPYGAISLANNNHASVTTVDLDSLTIPFAVKRPHPRPQRSGVIGQMKSNWATQIPVSIAALPDPDRNVFVRNLMHEAGMNVRVRRRGDTNMRIDAVGLTRSGRPFVAEIELVGGDLESPRALMEDVAILHARYGFAVGDIDAVSIIMAFPNVRSEYYQVMRDIDAVLGIKCRTLTVGALLAVVWTGGTIDGFDDTAFSIEPDGIDLAKSLIIQAEAYPAALRPAK